MPEPILNQSIETAGKGITQGIAKSLNYFLGSQDVLIIIGVIVFLFILWRFLK